MGLTLGFEQPLTKAFSLYFEGFLGYGDTLIEFDKKVQRVSFGFIFSNDLF